NLTINGVLYPYPTTADGFANAVAGIAGLSTLTSAYRVSTPAPDTLGLSLGDGGLIPITIVQEDRNRTNELVTTPNPSTDTRPHYTSATVNLDETLAVTEGDVWQIELNGHKFSYPV